MMTIRGNIDFHPSIMARALGIVILIVSGCVLATALFWKMHKDEDARLERSFNSDAYTRAQLISGEINNILSQVDTLQRFYKMSSSPDKYRLKDLVPPLLVKDLGIETIQWVPRIMGKDRAGYEQRERDAGSIGFRFTEKGPRGEIVAANQREVYYPVSALDPLDRNEELLGFDYGSSGEMLDVMEKSRDTGKTLATGRISLVQVSGDSAGIVIFGPVYNNGLPLETPEQRRTALAGFLACGLRLHEVMRAAINKTPPMNMPTELLDLSAPREKRSMYQWQPRLVPDPGRLFLGILYPKPPIYRNSFSFAEREWQVVISAGPLYLQRHYSLVHWMILPGGYLLTFVLTLYMYTILARRQQAEALAEKKTSELKLSDQKYRGLFEQNSEGIIICDINGGILDANRSALDMLQYGLDEIRGRSYRDIVPARRHGLDDDIERDQIYKQGFSDTYERECVRKDGFVFPASMRSLLLRDEQGKVSRVTVLFQDITERKFREEESRLKRLRMESLVRIFQHHSSSNQELLDFALDEAIELSGSTIGYIYYYDDVKQEFTLNTWSRGVMEECTVTDRENLTVYQLGKTGIWGEAVRQSRPILMNDFQAPHPLKRGYPEGHAHLKKFMTIPIFSNGRIVGVIGVANKDTDYNEEDIQQLTLLMNSVWQITERRKAEEELRKSQQMLLMVLDSIPVHVFWKDRESHYLGCNRLMARNTGLGSPERIVGRSDFDLGAADMAEASMADDRRVMESGRPMLEYEELLVTPDGRRNWFLTSKIPLRDHEGKVNGILGISYDVTERKWMDQALRQERDRVQMYLDTARVMILVLDRGGEITLINRRGCELTGYAESELIGKNWFEMFIPEEQKSAVVQSFRRMVDGETDPDRYFENSLTTKSGAVRLMAWNNTVVRDEEGNIIGTLSSGEDITEQRQAEDALKQSRERFRKIFEDMPLASSYADDMGNIEFINKVFMDLFGYTLRDIPTIGDWFMRAYPDRDYREEAMARWNADATRAKMEGTRIGPGEYHVTCMDGSVRICEITGTFLEKGVMTVFNDLTERIRAEKTIRQSEERFRVQFKGIPIPTYIWKSQDEDFILLDFNDAALDFTKGRISSFRGIPASRFYKDKAGIFDDMKRCLGEQVNIRNEFWDTLRTTGEKKYMSVKYAFVPPDLVMVHMEDSTAQKEAEEHLRYLSIHDPLTGLYNRFYADTEIQRLKTSRKFPVSVIVVDIDGLKALNDSEGHAAGDLLIKNAAYVLRQTFRPEDVVARIGGDEFLVILPAVDAIILEQTLNRLRVYLSNFNASGPQRPVSFSIGAASAHSGDELEDCIKQADMLMYLEKARMKALQGNTVTT